MTFKEFSDNKKLISEYLSVEFMLNNIKQIALANLENDEVKAKDLRVMPKRDWTMYNDLLNTMKNNLINNGVDIEELHKMPFDVREEISVAYSDERPLYFDNFIDILGTSEIKDDEITVDDFKAMTKYIDYKKQYLTEIYKGYFKELGLDDMEGDYRYIPPTSMNRFLLKNYDRNETIIDNEYANIIGRKHISLPVLTLDYKKADENNRKILTDKINKHNNYYWKG